MARKTLTDKGVGNLKPRDKRYAHPDPELRGHYVRVTPTDAKSFCAVARDPVSGKQIWATIGGTDLMGIEEAREKARGAIKRIRAGLQPFEPPPMSPQSVRAVSDNWFKRHVEAKGLRSAPELRRVLDRYILPVWGEREFLSIRRSDIAALLDKVEDENGQRTADYVLQLVRGIMNWHASRSDDYLSPVARGMRRTDPKSRKRDRILDDAELCTIWAAAEQSGTYGAIVRLALLTAQRREKIATIKWTDISIDGEWRIVGEEREKGTAGSLMLPEMALSIIQAQPRFESNPYVLAGRGTTRFNDWSKCKLALDQKTPGLAPWTVHDLRRTARSLMSRAGVRPEVGERVLGHVISGVAGVYDRHSYAAEKRDALQRLATLIETILNPSRNVIAFPAARP